MLSSFWQKSIWGGYPLKDLILCEAVPNIRSAVDFGCGVGSWLSILQAKGADDVLGLDGPWVDQALLEIPQKSFRQVDFESKVELDKKYDLAITLEVAEHISPSATQQFMDSLVSAADVIMFSAAIPFQGGRGHVNEQWPDYWAELFSQRGYVAVDFIRSKIWNEKEIPVWYQQNILVFVKAEQLHTLNLPEASTAAQNTPLSLVHPDIFIAKVKHTTTVKGCVTLLRQALERAIKEKFRSWY